MAILINGAPSRLRLWAGPMAGALCLAILALAISWRLAGSTRRAGEAATAEETLQAAPVVFNFRNVSPAQRPTATFTIRNHSGQNIKIIRVIPSCSCVSARCPTQSLGPGGITHVYATFDATLYSDYQGPFSKYVSVLYRLAAGTRTRVLQLLIEGKLVDAAPFFAYPSTVDLSPLRAGSAGHSTIYLRGWKSAVRHIPNTVTVSAGKTRAIAVQKGAAPGPDSDRTMQINVTIPSAAGPGRFQSRVVFPLVGFSPVVIAIRGKIVAAARPSSSAEEIPEDRR